MQHKFEDANIMNRRWRTSKSNQMTPTHLLSLSHFDLGITSTWGGTSGSPRDSQLDVHLWLGKWQFKLEVSWSQTSKWEEKTSSWEISWSHSSSSHAPTTSRKHGKKEPQSLFHYGFFLPPWSAVNKRLQIYFFGLPTEILRIWGLLIYC
jgi:hypothetical protein